MCADYQEVVAALPAMSPHVRHRDTAPSIDRINHTRNNGDSPRQMMSHADKPKQRIHAPPSMTNHSSRQCQTPEPHMDQRVVEVTANPTMQTAARKAVHWSPLPGERGSTPTAKRGILRYTPSVVRQTTPFSISLWLGPDEFTVHFESVPAIHAKLEKFEAELLNAVPPEYKELLRVNLDAGYKLRVRRFLHTATAVFDSEDPSDRGAVFYAFLNCVFRDAKVTLIW
jgi:hypothetical protein